MYKRQVPLVSQVPVVASVKSSPVAPWVTTTADPMTPGVRKVKVTLWPPLAVAMGKEPKFVTGGAMAVAATAELTTSVTVIVAVPGYVA